MRTMTTMIPLWNQIPMVPIFSACSDDLAGERGSVGTCTGGSSGELGNWGGDSAGAAKQF